MLKLHQSSRLISRALLIATLLSRTIMPYAAAATAVTLATDVTAAQVAGPIAMVIPAPVAISIPMRDGVRLGADLYLAAGKGPFPVLLSITPYAKGAMRRFIRGTWIAGGYAVVIVDSRGLGSSGGQWQPYINEGRDGFDVQQWIGRQSWCNGRIGMFGVSYPAYSQVAPAPYRSRYVRAIVPISAQSDNYGSVWLTDGILHLAFGPRGAESEQAVADKRKMPSIDWVKVVWTLPLDAIPRMLPIKSPFMVDVIQNEAYDGFWRAMSVRQKYSQMDVPALHVTGWYDDLSNETQLNFIGMSHSSRSRRSRGLQHLLIGPWGHGVPNFPQGDWVYGDVDFGTAPKIDFDAMEQRWFDFFLKGIKNGVNQEAPVRVFAMGANVWRNYQQWPPARAVPTSYYFHSDGFANTRFGNGTLNTTAPGTEPPDHYRYDPRNPVPTHGGHGCCDYQFLHRAVRPERDRAASRCAGVHDRTPREGRRDCRLSASTFGVFHRCAGYGFLRDGERCISRWTIDPDYRRRSTCSLSPLDGAATVADAKPTRFHYGAAVGNEQCLQKGTSDPCAHHQQQLSKVC